MPQAVQTAKTVSLATQRTSENLFYCVADGLGGVLMVPKPAMQKVLDRYEQTRTRDQQPSMNNLHGRAGSSSGGWDRLPGRSRDESPGTSQGTTGSATGGRPKHAEREPPRAALKSGAFTVDQPGGRLTGGAAEKPGTMNQHRNPSLDQEPDEEDLGLGEKVGEVGPLPEGCVYKLVPQDDGMVAIILCEDDGEDLNQNSSMRTHSLGDAANVAFFKRLNGIHRRKWSRTRDADFAETRRTTVYRHHLGPGERIALEGPNSFGTYDLVLYSRTADLTGPVQPGARGSRQEPNNGSMPAAQTWSASAGSRPGEHSIHELDGQISTGDRRMSEAVQLRSMNQANARFWAR